MECYYNHYIAVNDEKLIVDGWSDYWRPDKDISQAVCITNKGGIHFELDCKVNPELYTRDGIPLYKWNGAEAILRTDKEIEADREAIPPVPPSPMDIIEAQVSYTAMMTDTVLEV